MTFISKSPKYPIIYQTDLKQIGRIGPGSYNPHQLTDKYKKNSSQYIFNSKINRTIDFHNNSKLKQNQQVGPGKYQINSSYNNCVIKKYTNSCQSVFKSDIQRFPKQKQPIIQQKKGQINIYQYLLNKDDDNKIKGKLYGVTRQKNKIQQSIPSIPCNQQSFGYRIDTRTKKLVQNQNPNILLARKSYLNSSDSKLFRTTDSGYNNFGGPGSYFIKDQFGKNAKVPIWHKNSPLKSIKNKEQQINDIEVKQLEKYTLMDYDKKKWNEKGNNIINKQHRFIEQKISKKHKLLMNALRQKFQNYIEQGDDIEQIINQGIQRKNKQIIKNNQRNNTEEFKETQCFGSKEDRLSCNNLKNKNNRNNENIEKLKNSIICNTNQKQSQQGLKSLSKKQNIIPFGSKDDRFHNDLIDDKLKNNKKLGPGSYSKQILQASPQKDIKGSIWSKQQQTRFKKEQQCPEPGPGYYNTSVQLIKKQKQIKQRDYSQYKFHPNENKISDQYFISQAFKNSTETMTNNKQLKQKKQNRYLDLRTDKQFNQRKILKQIRNVVEQCNNK